MVLLLGFLVPCGAQETVTISGSSTALPLVEACAEAFNSLQSQYFATVTGGGTGAGIVGIAERRYDLAMASRELEDDELERFGDNFQEFLIGYDGIVIAISPKVSESGIEDLSTEQVRLIYAGDIKNWRDVGGPDREIYVIGREPGSGTRDTFNEVIFGNITVETPGVDTVALGSAEVKTAIAGSDKGIGYLGFSYAEGDNIRTVSLDGVMPSVKSIRNGSYELGRPLFLYSFNRPKPGAIAFIRFVQSPLGQKIGEENGFIPVVPSRQAADLAANISSAGYKSAASDLKKVSGFEAVWLLATFMAILGLFRLRSGKNN